MACALIADAGGAGAALAVSPEAPAGTVAAMHHGSPLTVDILLEEAK